MDFDIYNVLSNDNNIINEQLSLQHNDGGLLSLEKQLQRQLKAAQAKKDAEKTIKETFAVGGCNCESMTANPASKQQLQAQTQQQLQQHMPCQCDNCVQRPSVFIMEHKILIILVFILSVICLNQYFTYQQTMNDMRMALGVLAYSRQGNTPQQLPIMSSVQPQPIIVQPMQPMQPVQPVQQQ